MNIQEAFARASTSTESQTTVNPDLLLEHQDQHQSVSYCDVPASDLVNENSEVGTSENPQIADSSFCLRICEPNFLPQSNRQCCLNRGKTAWKKWRLLLSGLEVNVRELMTFFFLEVNVWSMAKFDLQN